VVGRRATDFLRAAKRRRESYTGPWLPEPVANEPDPALDPAAAAELADSLSMALLVVLETLSPLERAAFVLREVFDRPYAEVAATLGRSEQAVRQLVHRARGRVDDGHARFSADVATHTQVVSRFLAACQGADLEALLAVLAPDVVIISDSGGQAQAPRRPVYGQDKVARLLVGFAGRVPEGLTFGLEYFNGSVGIVARIDGGPFAAMAVTVAEGAVQSLQLIVNPEKLAFLQGFSRLR
jgi:Sigma-70, region 4